MDFLLVTGLSGAGKSQAAHALEDIGYFCIDNIPSELIERLVGICRQNDENGRYAAVIDIRSHSLMGSLFETRDLLVHLGCNVRLLYLDAADEVLVRRYKETRRRHPLMREGGEMSLPEAVSMERRMLNKARVAADYVIDTSQLRTGQLKERIDLLFSGRPGGGMKVSIMSFGFKYGLPSDADLVFDVRCLPNPHYIEELRPLTGLDERVSSYIFSHSQSRELLSRLDDLVTFSLPLYAQEGKSHLVIAVGCTGGHHRSVAFAQELCQVARRAGVEASVFHRDSERI